MAKKQQFTLLLLLPLIFLLFSSSQFATARREKCRHMFGECRNAFAYIAPHLVEKECMRVGWGSINRFTGELKDCGFLNLGVKPVCWVCPGIKPPTPEGANCGTRWAPCKTELEYMTKFQADLECGKLSKDFSTFAEQFRACGFMDMGVRARCILCPGTSKNATVVDPSKE